MRSQHARIWNVNIKCVSQADVHHTVYTYICCRYTVVYQNRCFGRHNERHFVHRRQIDSVQDCARRRARYVDRRSSRRSHQRGRYTGISGEIIVTVFQVKCRPWWR